MKHTSYRELVDRINATLNEDYSEEELEEDRKANCWKGHKRVPGTKPYSKGSCEKVSEEDGEDSTEFIIDEEEPISESMSLMSYFEKLHVKNEL